MTDDERGLMMLEKSIYEAQAILEREQGFKPFALLLDTEGNIERLENGIENARDAYRALYEEIDRHHYRSTSSKKFEYRSGGIQRKQRVCIRGKRTDRFPRKAYIYTCISFHRQHIGTRVSLYCTEQCFCCRQDRSMP